MATATTPVVSPSLHDKFAKGPGMIGTLIFVAVLIAGVIYIGVNLSRDLIALQAGSALPYILLAWRCLSRWDLSL